MRHVHVVPHTHWDREWYDPYPAFRIRLVELLDELLPRLEGDDRFSHFQLDGQMAVVDDYLEVRPDAAPRLALLNRSGRLSMGPWYVLPDEFLVSGETLVRNLQLGRRRADELGGSMQVGYLPDMFGHIAQMPQLLASFGLEHAVVWRGVPSTITTPAFRWRAPDGTEVRAEYLPGGYGNGSDMPPSADRLARRIELFVDTQAPMVGDTVLWMAGMDHEAPPAHLPAVVADLDSGDLPWSATIGSLSDYLSTTTDDGLPVHEGELRSGARANLLMGVTSNRVDVKAAAARAERVLERVAEPLDSLWQADPDRYGPLLELAWLEVIRNAAHDSICACSHDDVVDAVLHRYAEATRTAEEVAARAVRAAGDAMELPGTYLVNPRARPRDEVVELVVATGELTGVTHQVLEDHPAVQALHRTGAADAPVVVARELMFEHPDTTSVRLESTSAGLEVHLLPRREDGTLSPGDGLGELGRRCHADPELRVTTVLHRAVPTRRVLVRSGEVPGFGWRRWTPTEVVDPVGSPDATSLTNGRVTVRADPDDGTWSLDGLPGFGRLVDGGDAGDTYNWCPPDDDTLVEGPTSVHVEVAETGPLRGRLVVTSVLTLPERVIRDGDGRWRRTGRTDQVVTTTLELRAGEPFVRVEVHLDHHIDDHRLRVHLPLPRRCTHSVAECAFATVRRPLWAEGGPNEWGVPTFPSRRFVSAGGLTLVHEGLCEYELVDLDGPADDPATTAGELAVTLVRATGWLSRGPMASRPLPAGPEDRLRGAQAHGPLTLRCAVGLDIEDPWALADQWATPLRSVDAPGGGRLPAVGSHLDVRGAEVTAVLRDGERLVVRSHEADGEHGELRIPGRHGRVVDLDGVDLGTFEGSMSLRPWQIVTVSLAPVSHRADPPEPLLEDFR